MMEKNITLSKKYKNINKTQRKITKYLQENDDCKHWWKYILHNIYSELFHIISYIEVQKNKINNIIKCTN